MTEEASIEHLEQEVETIIYTLDCLMDLLDRGLFKNEKVQINIASALLILCQEVKDIKGSK